MTTTTGEPAVVRFGDRRLRVRSEAIEPDSDRSRETATALWDALAGETGVALAAPQIGLPYRVIVVDDPRTRQRQQLTMVNPAIECADGRIEYFEEGCLSFPGLYVQVARPQRVAAKYWDLAGKERRLTDSGLLARIIQHEIDHLDGVLFIDRLPRWRRWALAGRLWWLKRGRGG